MYYTGSASMTSHTRVWGEAKAISQRKILSSFGRVFATRKCKQPLAIYSVENQSDIVGTLYFKNKKYYNVKKLICFIVCSSIIHLHVL